MTDDPLLSSPLHVQALSDLGTARGMVKVMRTALEHCAGLTQRPRTRSSANDRRLDMIAEISGAALRRVREIEAAQAAESGEGRDG